MTNRLCKEGFLPEYRRYTESTEVPVYFALWCGVTIIGACLERKCYLVTRPIVYPNLYTILVAESALCRKSTAVNQAIGILRAMNNPPRMLAQKTSVQKLVAKLSQSGPKITDKETGNVSSSGTTAQGIIVSSELGNLISRHSYHDGLIDFLTDAYDCGDTPFVYDTHVHGEQLIREPCITILGATTMSWMKTSVPEEAIGGGFTSRVVFVHSQPSENDFAWAEVTNEVLEMEERLTEDLDRIRMLEGAFTPTPDARELYSRLYTDFKRGSSLGSNPLLAGYVGRRGTLLHKIAMIFSASYGDSMSLTTTDYQQANKLLCYTEEQIPEVIRSVTATDAGQAYELVGRLIRAHESITRSELIQKVSHRLRAAELDDVVDTLIKAGAITVLEEKNTIYYVHLGEAKK